MAARKARGAKAPSRRGAVARKTKETDVDVSLALDGGTVRAATGVPFFDHMLDQLGRHGGLSLAVKAAGDLHVDAHHTVEDVGIAIGEALRQATADKAGLARYGHAVVPLDEALVEAVVDLSGRPHLTWNAEAPLRQALHRRLRRRPHPGLLPGAREPRPHHAPRERAPRPEPPPRGGGHLQGHRPRAARRPPPRGGRDPVHEGPAVSRGTIALVDYGAGNLRSVENALREVGAEVVVTRDPDVVRRAGRIVVPGQGSMPACADAMRASGVADALVEALARGAPHAGHLRRAPGPLRARRGGRRRPRPGPRPRDGGPPSTRGEAPEHRLVAGARGGVPPPALRPARRRSTSTSPTPTPPRPTRRASSCSPSTAVPTAPRWPGATSSRSSSTPRRARRWASPSSTGS